MSASERRAIWRALWRPRPPAAPRGTPLRGTLSVGALTLMGVGGVVGTGIFVITGEVAAQHSGPAVALAFVLAALAAGLTGLCYAEMVAMVPSSGSAYSYVLATLGELPAFVVAWNLILEYGVAAAYVAVGWSRYFADVVRQCTGVELPWQLVTAPWALDPVSRALVPTGGLGNLAALAVLAAVAAVLCGGLRLSLRVAAAAVAAKALVIVLFLATVGPFVRLANLRPLVPPNAGTFGHFGASGVLQGATMLFFTYCGFDAVSTAAGECRNPQRDVPRAMFASLLIATLIYVAVAGVLCGAAPLADLAVADPLAVGAAVAGRPWLTTAVSLGALVGLSTVMLVQVFGQARVLLAMSQDGLLPRSWGHIDPHSAVPRRLTMGVALAAGAAAAWAPHALLGELTSMGTLLAFALVAAGVVRLRHTAPDAPRPFRVPGGPWGLPLASLAVSGLLLCTGTHRSLLRLAAWSAVGLVAYAASALRRRGHLARFG